MSASYTRRDHRTPMREVSQDENEAVVSRLRAGDDATFEELFRCYYRDLFRFAQFRIQDICAAEEIVQDVFLDVWRRRQTLHPKGTLRAYLYSAIQNKCHDHLRKQYVRVRLKDAVKFSFEQVDTALNPDQMIQNAQLRQAIDRAIEELPERRQTVFVLARLQGLSNVEIAAILKISVKTVENHMTAALHMLRERLSPLRDA